MEFGCSEVRRNAGMSTDRKHEGLLKIRWITESVMQGGAGRPAGNMGQD